MKYCILLALIAFALVPAYGQEEVERFDCTEEIFRALRSEHSCRFFFVCLIGRRVDFFCDEGYIFAEDFFECFPGYEDTCEYAEGFAPYAKPALESKAGLKSGFPKGNFQPL